MAEAPGWSGRAPLYQYQSACAAEFDAESEGMIRGLLETWLASPLLRTALGSIGATSTAVRTPEGPPIKLEGKPGEPGNLLTGLAQRAGVSVEFARDVFALCLQSAKGRRFSREPADIVRAVLESSKKTSTLPKVAGELDVSLKTLQNWRALLNAPNKNPWFKPKPNDVRPSVPHGQRK